MSNPKIIAFDIETGGLPPERIREIAPDFREESVKVGNLGIEKAVEKIQAAKLIHYDRIDREAALNAEYGQVLAIGWFEDEFARGEGVDDQGITQCTILNVTPSSKNPEEEGSVREKDILRDFWDRIDNALLATQYKELWVGHNIFGFDLPFLIRRSLILGVDYPLGVLERDRYWSTIFVDTMTLFAAGEFRKTISLDRFCKACGLPGKNGSGEHFADLYEEDEDAALDYLRNDINITQALAETVVPIARRVNWTSKEVSS